MIGIGDAFEKPFPETAAEQGQSSCSDVTSFSEMVTQQSRQPVPDGQGAPAFAPSFISVPPLS